MKGSVDYHKRTDFRALDVFVDAIENATPIELYDAHATAREQARDFRLDATRRATWRKLASLLYKSAKM